MEIKKEIKTEKACETYGQTITSSEQGNFVADVVPKSEEDCEQSEVTSATSTSAISTSVKWSPGRWQDATRKSAFQPYKPSRCTVLTNLQRGNTQAETPIPEDVDVNFHTRAGQGEICVQDILRETSVDVTDTNDLTALHWAATYGQIKAVHLLLQHEANVNFLGPEGESPLLLAAAGGHHEVIRVLLNEGANVNHVDNVGNSALMYAAHGDHPHSCNELLLRGADITIVNHAGDTAFKLAINNNSKLAQAVIENYMLTLLSAN